MKGVTTSRNDNAMTQQNRLTDDRKGTQMLGD
jgi:hypothetical protein